MSSKALKRRVREHMTATGMSYQAALQDLQGRAVNPRIAPEDWDKLKSIKRSVDGIETRRVKP